MRRRSVDEQAAHEVTSAPSPTHIRSAYLWNTAGSLINAFQSVVMLMVLMRTTDVATAGAFSLAYANANLFLNIGNWGMRNYEASDVKPENSFRAYARSRIATSVLMVVASWTYLAYSATQAGYGLDKVWVVALMTLFKGMDAVEDVFDGNYQHHGRLDVAGKLMTLRVGTATLVFCLVVALTKNLALATAAGTAWTTAVLVLGLVFIRRRHGLPMPGNDAPNQRALPLLRECLPLFLAAFLLFYIGNAPKWAIDALMDDAAQATYGFIAMPVFVVSLLAQFVYMPMVRPLTDLWEAGDGRGFCRAFLMQVAVVGGITIACTGGAALLGVPVLCWLYNIDLAPWRTELIVLVLGGGFLALATLANMGLTIMRKQHQLVWGYVAISIAAWFGSTELVRAWGITGAATCYIACMTLLAAWCGGLFVVEARRG